MSRSFRWTVAAGVIAVAVALFLPAAADWLVMRDGSRVETAGPWRVESRVVVFKRPDGTFASVRASDVDLEASERATREAADAAEAEARPGKAPTPREPVLRLTEKDLPPVTGPTAAREGAEQESAGQEATADREEPPEPLQIVNWRETGGVDTPGIEIVGTVRNNSESLAIGVGVTAVLFDQEDDEAARASAILTSTALQPGQTSAFRVSFPGVYQYGRADLEARGNLIRTERPESEEPAEGGR